MAAITQLKQMAIGVANQMHMLALNADQGDAKAEAQAALAYNRAIGFQPKVHDTFQCPRCWVANETRSVLTSIGGGETSDAFFQCDTCELKVSLVA
jgi:hypothetical protein